MAVIIENIQSKVQFTEKTRELIEKVVTSAVNMEGLEFNYEVSIYLTDDRRIKEINMEQRSINRPTDVLSFPIVDMVEGKLGSYLGDMDMESRQLLLGDIVISLETAARQAEEYGHTFERELAFLVCHGIFHLLGYDHQDDIQERKMILRQENVLSGLGLNRE
ncbi:MAG: rRNA maturation RNase YbeY [Acetivibrionales bacterium]